VITNAGQRLGERYVLQERLAVGGMGEVWSAVDEVLNRPVAVKVLRTDLAPDAAFQARFRAEARTAAGLSHGGIAAVYDYGEVLGSAYLVMELVPGEPLSQMIADEGALGTDRTLQIVSQAARALHAAHRHGVIHRDIKPANLMVTPELRVKVTDFGIARPRDHEPLTATGQVMGTAHYLAPELARGEIASPLSDVYALGVVAYECLAGWRPFEGDNQVAVATAHLQDEPPPLPETVPGPIREIVESAMSKNPAGRPQGANVLASLMEDLRLRGLARGNSNLDRSAPTTTSQTWPSDADTPPRGGQASPSTSRRQAALDRANPADPSRPSPGPSRDRDRDRDRAYRNDGYPAADPYREGQRPAAYGNEAPYPNSRHSGDRRPDRSSTERPPADRHARDRDSDDRYGEYPNAGYPNAERPPSGYQNSGQQNSGYQRPEYPGAGRSRGDYDESMDQRDQIPGFPTRGDAAAFAPGGRQAGRPRGSHSRAPQSSDPYANERSSGRPGRRKLTIPLIALAVLIVLVVLGSLLAHRGNSSGGTHSLGVPGGSVRFVLAPEVVTSG
jgi:serine/threonine protein kinase